MRLLPLALVVTVATISTTRVPAARADDGDDPLAPLAATAHVAQLMIVAGEVTPVVLGVVDLAARPTSRGYGAMEMLGGATLAIINVQLAAGDSERAMLFGVLAVIDAAVAAHGGYLAFRRTPPPTAFRIGAARGHVTPTLVGDGRALAPGLGVAARW